MRVVALLGPVAKEHHIRQFEVPGVDIFSGNEVDPTDRPDAVMIFGGDGTIHRHLGALALTDIPVLLVPLGSANDFAASLGLENIQQSLAAWRRFCASGDNTRLIDLGTIRQFDGEGLKPQDTSRSDTAGLKAGPSKVDAAGRQTASPEQGTDSDPSAWQGESLETLHFVPSGPRPDLPKLGPRIMQSQLRRAPEVRLERATFTYFGCIAGTGLDAAVNRLTLNQPRWVRSHGGYVAALLQVLGSFRPPHVTLSVEIDGRWENRIDEGGYLVAAGNGPQYGHRMRLTHEAQMDDGLLDVCFVRQLSKMRLLRLFRLVYRGAHIGLDEVEYFRAASVRLKTEPASEVFADGEYICRTPVEMGVQRQGLSVIVVP